MSILLIGYRGSGKTTVGRLLAAKLRWSFVDLDETIVRLAGKTIKEIFEQRGEEVFRSMETRSLNDLILLQKHVISLGGGAVLAEENRRTIKASEHQVVYLKADAEELHRRIIADPVTMLHRPGLTHLGGSVEEVRQLLAQREPLYQTVKTIEVNAMGTTDQVVDRICSVIENFN